MLIISVDVLILLSNFLFVTIYSKARQLQCCVGELRITSGHVSKCLNTHYDVLRLHLRLKAGHAS